MGGGLRVGKKGMGLRVVNWGRVKWGEKGAGYEWEIGGGSRVGNWGGLRMGKRGWVKDEGKGSFKGGKLGEC